MTVGTWLVKIHSQERVETSGQGPAVQGGDSAGEGRGDAEELEDDDDDG